MNNDLDVYKKRFTGFLILNWKSGKMEIKKRKPRSVTGYQIVANLDLTVIPPKETNVMIKGEIPIAEGKLVDIFVESI